MIPPRPYASLLDRVLAHVEPIPACGCWIWTGAALMNNRGMPRAVMTVRRRRRGSPVKKVSRVYVHRAVLADKLGVPLYRLNIVRHTCDVSLCVNPAHLVGGTRSQNNYDAYRRGRR